MVVEYELAEDVARIYLNRPHRLNAVVPELAAGLVAAFTRAGQDGARVIVLAGGAGRSAPAMTSRRRSRPRPCLPPGGASSRSRR